MSFKEWGASKSWSFADNRIRIMLKELYAGLLDTLKIGSDTGYLEIDENGDLFLRGDSTVWDDLRSSLIGNKLASVSGGVKYDYEESTVIFKTGGDVGLQVDRVIWNMQMPHATKVDSNLHVHIHWEQFDAVSREFTLMYRIQDNNVAKNTTWTSVVTQTNDGNAFTYPGSGTFNQITELGLVDLTGLGISAIVQLRLIRTDSVAGDIHTTFVDAHHELDQMGSRQEYVK